MNMAWHTCRLLFIIDCILDTITILSKLSYITKLSKTNINGKNALPSLIKNCIITIFAFSLDWLWKHLL